MGEFFPQGFWPAVATIGMVLFLVFGLDLLFGAKLILGMSRVVNKKFQFDQIVVHALEELKKASDREYDMEGPLLKGWGRFVISGLLLFGALMLFLNVIPRLT
jgi:hypothetical protein